MVPIVTGQFLKSVQKVEYLQLDKRLKSSGLLTHLAHQCQDL